ncbi:putative RNA polymerase II nuclear localization protein SLC7A6OS [Discoglossus pictus]
MRPSLGSTQRIQRDLRASKEAARQESRYRLIASHRPAYEESHDVPGTSHPAGPTGASHPAGPTGASHPAGPTGDMSPSEAAGDAETSKDGFQLFDMVQEDPEKEADAVKESEPETILCNSVKMIRERLTVSETGPGSEHRESADEFVYDIYYSEASPHGWIQDILSVQPYSQEQELVAEDNEPEETYEDEDDENEENNWRNDYPDEEDEEGSDKEERYLGYYEDSDEEDGIRGHAWTTYRKKTLQEMNELNSD